MKETAKVNRRTKPNILTKFQLYNFSKIINFYWSKVMSQPFRINLGKKIIARDLPNFACAARSIGLWRHNTKRQLCEPDGRAALIIRLRKFQGAETRREALTFYHCFFNFFFFLLFIRQLSGISVIKSPPLYCDKHIVYDSDGRLRYDLK